MSPKQMAPETRNAYNTVDMLQEAAERDKKALVEKDLLIKKLQMQLKQADAKANAKGKLRFEVVREGAKKKLDEMVVHCDQWRKSSLAKIQKDLAQASQQTDTLAMLRQSDFYLDCLKSIDELEY